MKRTIVGITCAIVLAACGGKAADAPGEPLAKGSDSLPPMTDVQQLPPPPSTTTTVTTTTTTKPTPPKPAPKPVVTPPATPPASAPVKSPPAAPASGATLAIGKTISTTTIDSVHSRYTKIGDAIRTRVAADVMSDDGRVVIPAGSIVTMHVTEIAQADSRGEKGTLSLALASVDINGTSHSLSGTATDYEYEMKARGVQSGDVAKTGAGAVAGAILGRVIGGKKGTIVGAVGGGVVGAAVASSTANRDIIVHAGKPMTLTLNDRFSAR